MQASFAFAGAIIITAIMASLSGAYAPAAQPAVPNAGVITPTAPVVPPYLRDPKRLDDVWSACQPVAATTVEEGRGRGRAFPAADVPF